ncbi:threonine synthase [Promicromonospora soli]
MSTYLRELMCVHCDTRFAVGPMSAGCPACRTETFASSVTPTYDYERLRRDLGDGLLREPDEGLWRYRRLLPVQDARHEVTLGEGGTPLVALPSLAGELAAEDVWIKDESRNPTWTFKDRNAAVTVSTAVELGAQAIVVSTSGNYGASIAAYAARAGVECVALTYPGIPEGTRTLIQAFGADLKVVAPEERWEVMQQGMREKGWYPASNYTAIPTNGAFGHEGYKTIAYEITEALGTAPDLVSVPTAYGEGLFGIWKGFDEMKQLGRVADVPRMLGCEPAGGPLALAMADPSQPIARVPRTPTVARGIGGSVNTYVSVAALHASGGTVAQADDEAIMAAQRRLAAEGFFVEPASAAALAGLRTLAAAGDLPEGLRIVLVNTSSGLKNLEAFNTAFSDRELEPATHGAF